MEIVGLKYSDIQFFQNNRVTVYQEIEDREILFLAECGIYTPLKETAILIWDTLGTAYNNQDEDIEFFLVWIDSKPFAKFTIFPDMQRTRYNAVSHDRLQTNWTVDRAELLLEIGIEVEEVEANTIDQVEELVVVAVKLYFIGRKDRQAARMFMKDLLGLVDLRTPTVPLPGIKEPEYV